MGRHEVLVESLFRGSRSRFLALSIAIAVEVVAGRVAAEEADAENARLAREADEALRPRTVGGRSFGDRPIHLLANVGFGTLVGLAGVTAGYSIHNRFELGGGIGVNESGPMGGPYVRVRPYVNTSRSGALEAVALDVGLSIGGYQWKSGAGFPFEEMSHTFDREKPEYRAERAHFLQVELSWEAIQNDGVMVRMGGGGTGLLNPGVVECVPPPSGGLGCGSEDYFASVFFVLVAGVGYAF